MPKIALGLPAFGIGFKPLDVLLSFLLKEDGARLLLETGGRIILENPDGDPSGGGLDATRLELFLDAVDIEETSGLGFTVNKPTKHAGNPLFGSPADTWDRDKNYCHVLKDAGGYFMYYQGVSDDVPTEGYVCYATSNNAEAWTRPNLGLITYEGSTDNNILLPKNVFNPAVVHAPDLGASQQYIMLTEVNAGGTSGAHLYQSPDKTSFSFLKTIKTVCEGKMLVRLTNSKWLAYYVVGHTIQKRVICAIVSDSSDPGGTWTDLGTIIPSGGQDDQQYSIGIARPGNIWLGFVGNYNKTTEQIHMDLYTSRDGLTWTLKSDQWVPLGSSGAWDDEMVLNGKGLVEVGNKWWFHYTGYAEDHATPPPRDARIGAATIDKQRIGQIGTTGTITAKPILPGDGAILTVNVNATGGGKLEVAALDAYRDTALPGYDTADCDDVTTDTLSTEVTWGGKSLPLGKAIKLKFTLTNATLYAYEVG